MPHALGFETTRQCDRNAAPVPLARWGLLAGLLLAEGLLLGVMFEGPDVGPGWWRIVLSHAHTAVRAGIAIATATLLLSGASWRGLRLPAAGLAPPRHLWPLLLTHVAAFAIVMRLTALVCGTGLAATAAPGLWVALWLAAGLIAVGSVLAVALPLRGWFPLARRLLGPLSLGVVVGTAALGVGQVTSHEWRPLGRLTLRVVQALLALIATDPLVDATHMLVGTQRFSVEIAPQCSGYEGIGLMWVFLGAYLWLFRRSLRFPAALLLVPIGTVLVWVLNALRIAGLIAVGTWISPEIALGGFHSYSGWLLFCGAALGLVAGARGSSFFAAPDSVGHSIGTAGNPTAAYLCPLLALVTVEMITGAFSAGGFDALYPVRVVAVAGTLWGFRRYYCGLHWTWSWTAVAAGVLVFLMWVVLEPAGPQHTALGAGLASLPAAWAAGWLGCRILGSVVTVPIAEELAFRGYVIRRLIASDFEHVPFHRFTWLSFVASSLLFGALHSRLVAGTLAGAAYALIMYRRGEICDAVLAHATTNALLAAYVLATGAWFIWA